MKVDAFWIDRVPVTNRDFRNFVRATGYVTFAEIAPDPEGLSRRSAAHAPRGLLGFRSAKARGRHGQLGPVVDVQVRRQLEAALWTAQFDQWVA